MRILFILMLAFSSSAYSANWYVDNAVTTNGIGTSWATAFKEMPLIEWGSVQPGDTIFVSGGTTSKTYTQGFATGKNGTSTLPITLRVGQDTGHNGQVIIDGDNLTIFHNYITVDGSVSGVSKLLVKNVIGPNKNTEQCVGASGTTGFVIKYVTLDNCNNGIGLTGADFYEVANNILEARGDWVINSISSPATTWSHNKIHHNVFNPLYLDGGPDGIQLGSGTDVYNNVFTPIQDSSTMYGQHPDSLQMAGSYIRVYNNTFDNVADSNVDFDASFVGEIRDIYVFNNLFHISQMIDPFPDFIRMYTTGMAITNFSNVKVLNNSFIVEPGQLNTTDDNIGAIMGFATGSATGSGNEVRNNLAKGTVLGIKKMGVDGPTNITWSNNVYPVAYTIDPTAVIGVPALDSGFVPLVTDTLAKNQGMLLSAYFLDDKAGKVRDANYDIGAFEYVAPPPPFVPPATPVAWFKLVSNLNDEYGNHGIANLAKAPAFTNGSMYCDGNDEVTVPYLPFMSFNDGSKSQFTVSVWVKPTAVFTDESMIVARYTDSSNSNYWSLQANGGLAGVGAYSRFTTASGSPSGYALSANILPPQNQWTHLVMTYDSLTGAQKLYIDGVTGMANYTNVTRPTGVLVKPTKNPISICGIPTNGITSGHFTGYVKDVIIYNRALDINEVNSIYANSAP